MSLLLRRNNLLFIVFSVFSSCISVSGVALEKGPEVAEGAPCAVLERFAGVVQVLDATRTKVVEVSRKAPIACGGSISVGGGWAQVKHRDGYTLYLGAGTFAEVPESNADGKHSGDSLVIYRGQVFAQLNTGSSEFRVLTANARARSTNGTISVIFNQEDEETQLISLENTASLENRFEAHAHVEVHAGEATSLNFKQMRVIPSDPRAVSTASLKAKLAQFQIPEREKRFAVRVAQKRQNRKFASSMQTGPGDKFSSDYSRSHLDPDDQKLQDKWATHVSAGEPVGEDILFPDKFHGRPQKGSVTVRDPAGEMLQAKDKSEETEKKKLIEELSKIRDE